MNIQKLVTIYKNWKLGFDCKWFTGEDFKLIGVELISFNTYFFTIVRIHILKFVFSIHVSNMFNFKAGE